MKVTLKAARVNSGYTQAEVAEMLNVSRVSIANWENGASEPLASHFKALCEVYMVNPMDIILPTT